MEGNVNAFVGAVDGLGDGDLDREMRRSRSCAERCPSAERCPYVVLLEDVVRVAARVTARSGRAAARVAASESAVAAAAGCSEASSGVAACGVVHSPNMRGKYWTTRISIESQWHGIVSLLT